MIDRLRSGLNKVLKPIDQRPEAFIYGSLGALMGMMVVSTITWLMSGDPTPGAIVGGFTGAVVGVESGRAPEYNSTS